MCFVLCFCVLRSFTSLFVDGKPPLRPKIRGGVTGTQLERRKAKAIMAGIILELEIYLEYTKGHNSAILCSSSSSSTDGSRVWIQSTLASKWERYGQGRIHFSTQTQAIQKHSRSSNTGNRL